MLTFPSIAWQQIKKGKPKDVLRLVQDAPVPRLAPDEVMVKGPSSQPEIRT
jgi:hypothetical protein